MWRCRAGVVVVAGPPTCETDPDLRSNRFSSKFVLLPEFSFPSAGRTRSGWIRPSFLPESCTFLLPSPTWQMETWLLFVYVACYSPVMVMDHFFLHPSFQLQWMDPGEWRRRQSTFRPSRSSGVELKAGIRSTSQRGPTRELPRGPPDRRPHH